MDNFIDKFAQRKNAQEMIRANAMAEAEEKEKLTAKLAEYELAIQEMRRCNLQNLENSEKVKELLAASLNKIEEVQKKDEESSERADRSIEEVRILLEGVKSQVAELLEKQQNQTAGILEKQQNRMVEQLKEQSALLERQNTETKELMDAQKKTWEELLHDTENFTHRESVKVYRNVQAVIEGALPKQTEEIKKAVGTLAEKEKTSKGIVAIWILTFLAAVANVAIEVLRILGYL